MIEQQTYVVTFEGVSPADASRYAEELRNALLDAIPDVNVQRKRDHPEAQDFGASLVIILGTPAAGAAITAISTWLQKRKSASIDLKDSKREIHIRNINNKNAMELAQLFLKK